MAFGDDRTPRDIQPFRIAQINVGNPLTRGLVLLWNGRFPQYAVGPGKATAINGSPGSRASQIGQSPLFAGAQDYRWDRAVTGTNPSEVTMFGAGILTSLVGELTMIGQSRSSGGNPLFRLHKNGTGFWQAQFRGDGGTFTNVTGGSAVVANQAFSLAGVFRSGSGVKELYVDGWQAATSTTDVGTITLDQTEIGSLVRNSAAQFWSGAISVAGIYNRALTSREIFELYQNPWQLFEPDPIQVYWPTVAGGGFSPAWARNRSGIIGAGVH